MSNSLDQKGYRIKLDNWKELSVETARTFYYEAENHLKDTVDRYRNFISNGNILLSVVIPIFTSSGAYIFFRIQEPKENDLILVAAVIALVMSCTVLGFVWQAIFPQKIYYNGSEPKSIIDGNVILKLDKGKKERKEEIQTINYLLYLCETYQDRIEFNDKIIKKQAWNYKYALKILIFIPFIIIIGLVVAKIVEVVG